MAQITEYRLAWHPGQNSGRARIKLQNGTQHEVPINTPGELAAVAAVLREHPVFLVNGEIRTGWEPIEE